MPYMSVIGIDRQERQTPKADKDPKGQPGVPKKRVKHEPPPLSSTVRTYARLRSFQREDQSVLDRGKAKPQRVVVAETKRPPEGGLCVA